MSVRLPDYTAPMYTVTNAPTDEAYWAKVYAGQIVAGLVACPGEPADMQVEWVAAYARDLAKAMCKEGEK